MKKVIAFLLVGFAALIPFSSFASQAEGGDVVFGVNPTSVSTTGNRIVNITLKVTIYEPQFQNFCGSGNNSAFNWLVATDQSTLKRPDGSNFSGRQAINSGQATQTFDLSGQAKMPLLSGIPTLNVWAKVQCTNFSATTVTKSAVVQVTNAGATGTVWACLASDGKYACSPGNKQDLSDVPNGACAGKNALQIDSTKCGASPGKFSCNSNGQCVTDPSGKFGDSTCNNTCSGSSGGGGSTGNQSYSFTIENPLNGGPNDLFDVINIATKWLLEISIPLAVLFILYAGFLMLTAGPTPAKFEKGKKILINVVIGLAVIFIGRGFITLIYSILELGGSNTNPPTSQNP